MHSDDVELVDRIERAFIENGYIPITGSFGNDSTQNHCGLGAIGCRDGMKEEEIAKIVGRSMLWVQGFATGFDMSGIGLWHLLVPKSDEDWMRGFDAGSTCGNRLFSKAPSEVVPVVDVAPAGA